MAKKKKTGFDLSEFSNPVLISAEGFGDVSLDIRTAAFNRWFENGEKESRWDDGKSFTRELFKDRSEIVETGSVPNNEKIDALNEAAINSLAQAVIDVSATVFFSQSDQSEKKDDQTELSASDALYHKAKENAEYYRQQSIRMLKQMREMTESPLIKLEKMLGPTYKLQKEMERMARGLGTFSYADKVALGLTSDAIGSSQYLNNLKSVSSATQLAHTKVFGNLAAITQAGSIGKELNAAVLGMDTASRLVREQLKTSRLFNERFHLGIDPKIFSSVGKFPELSSLQATTMSKVLADLGRPSAFNSAILAMQGIAPKGVLADVLKQHVSPIDLSHAAKFRTAFEGITSIDDTFFEGKTLSQAIISTNNSLEEERRRPTDLEYAAFLLALLVALITMRMWYLAEVSNDYQQQQIEISSSSATSVDMDEVIEAIKNSSTEISKSITKQGVDDPNVRFIHTDVRLRVEPHIEAQVIQFIFPDQIVRVVETKGHWAKVEIIDYRTEKQVRGWVPRSMLRHDPL